MRKPFLPSVLLGLVLAVLMSGCQKIEARMELKKGNGAYKQEQYKDALAFFLRGLELDPTATFAWRSVGLSSMALFKPGNKEPENLSYADQAISAFQKYLEDHAESAKTLEYLVNTYINAERYEEANAYLQQFATQHPDRADVHRLVVSVMTKMGRVEEALQWANSHELSQNDPQIYYTIGVNAWDKSYNDVMLPQEARPAIVDTGLAAMERALQLKKDFQSLVYYNLLYREKNKVCMAALAVQPTPSETPKRGRAKPTPTPDPAEVAKCEQYLQLANQYAVEAAAVRKAEKEREAAEAAKHGQQLGAGERAEPPPIPGTEPTAVPAAPPAEGEAPPVEGEGADAAPAAGEAPAAEGAAPAPEAPAAEATP